MKDLITAANVLAKKFLPHFKTLLSDALKYNNGRVSEKLVEVG